VRILSVSGVKCWRK